METCYKLIPGVLARALPMEGHRFEIEPEMTVWILQAGFNILEVPISYTPRKAKKLSPGAMAGLRWLCCCVGASANALSLPQLPNKCVERFGGGNSRHYAR